MNKQRLFLFILAFIAVVTFYISNNNLRGYLRWEVNQDEVASGNIEALDYYEITTKAPFKYRLLFPTIVKSTFTATHSPDDVEGYYHTYKAWSLVFFTASVLAMFFLLRAIGFDQNYSFLGSLIFLFLPPMLMAFTTPVHTREDTLAYTLLFTGLIFLIQERRIPFVVICFLGVLTRETLLLLPLLYLFYAKDENLIRRLAISAAPAVLFVAVRVIIGFDKYDVWEGLKWNLDNPEQVIGFLFITFNVCWIPFLLHLLHYRSSVLSSVGSPVHFFYKSSIFALAVILLTTFVGGIFNEIRLLYLFCPWIVVISVQFVRSNIGLFKNALAEKSYRIYSIAAIIFCLAIVYVIMLNWQRIIVPGKFRVPYEVWILASSAYMLVILLFLPVSLRFIKGHKVI
jgi:hypothetical protein